MSTAAEAPARRASVCSLMLRSLSSVASSMDESFDADDLSSRRKIYTLRSTNEHMIRGLDDVLTFVEGGGSRRFESETDLLTLSLVGPDPVSSRISSDDISDIIVRQEAELMREFEDRLQRAIQEAKAQVERQIEQVKERRERELVLAQQEAAAREEALLSESRNKVQSTIRSMTK